MAGSDLQETAPGAAAPEGHGDYPKVGRIPIRNLWLLMLYASNLYRELPPSQRVSAEGMAPAGRRRLLCLIEGISGDGIIGRRVPDGGHQYGMGSGHKGEHHYDDHGERAQAALHEDPPPHPERPG